MKAISWYSLIWMKTFERRPKVHLRNKYLLEPLIFYKHMRTELTYFDHCKRKSMKDLIKHEIQLFRTKFNSNNKFFPLRLSEFYAGRYLISIDVFQM